MMTIPKGYKVAVVGAGLAGAWCAHTLAKAGASVQVIDKSRGPGGRLATRRVAWVGRQGEERLARFDHGAPAFAARDSAFRQFVAPAIEAGALAPWEPVMAPGSREGAAAEAVLLGMPDMPALCRWLLQGLPTRWASTVEHLHRGTRGWQVEVAGEAPGLLPEGPFDAVVLAIPPAQAAPLLAAHRRDWAQRASLALMQPCWTLMGVSTRPSAAAAWDIARPELGPLSWAIRNDARPGRATREGEAHWVLHARAGWSRRHLEHPAVWVQAQLQAALQEMLGEPLAWQHAVVHRWRYARPAAPGTSSTPGAWWDAALGLGVCGDFLGGTGVEGAWQSAQAVTALMQAAAPRPGASVADVPEDAVVSP